MLPESLARAEREGVATLPLDLAESLPEHAGQFALVAAFDVMEHLTYEENRRLLDQVAALLSPGGLFVARFPNGQSPFGRVYQHGDMTHVCILSAAIVRQLLIGRPFDVVHLGNPAPVRASGAVRRLGSGARSILQRGTERFLASPVRFHDPARTEHGHAFEEARMNIPHPTPSGTRHLVAPELLKGLDVMPAFELTEQALPELRALGTRFLPQAELTAPQRAVRLEERFVAGPAGAPDVRVLIYTPAGEVTAPRPAYFFIHGGGYVLGVPETSDAANRELAAALDCVVFATTYRLAPEAPFPAARDDCHAALRWLHDHAAEIGVDRARIAIGGQSAGGGHTATLALYERDAGGVPICFQYLEAPMLGRPHRQRRRAAPVQRRVRLDAGAQPASAGRRCSGSSRAATRCRPTPSRHGRATCPACRRP